MNDIDRIFAEHQKRQDKIIDDFASSVRADMDNHISIAIRRLWIAAVGLGILFLLIGLYFRK